ncbi:MAG: DUF2188 domain-containing protein [Candidatus Sericytochromatia bacterium]
MKTLLTLISAALMISSLSACQSNGRMPLTAVPMYQAQSARVVYHVVHSNAAGVWEIKQQRNPQVLSTHRTKEEAVAAGRIIARAAGLGQLIVHKLNGQIETEYTYGKDPAGSVG